MKLKQRHVPFKVKDLDKTGEFSGYLSVFGNTDQYRDVMMPGAFSASLKTWAGEDALPPILWQHDSTQPIGPFTKLVEDDNGLYCEGTLLLDIPQAKSAYVLAKSGVIRGMSIGYQVDDEEYDGKNNVNRLNAVTLWEGSMVTFPANASAMITDIKSGIIAGSYPTLKEFEGSMRDAFGLNRDDAHVIATRGFVKLLELRDADKKQIEPGLDSVLAAIQSFCPSL